jgi:amidase
MADDLWQWSAGELAAAIREKRASSREVVQAHLDRIGAVNPKVNAVTVVHEEQALRQARRADEEIAAGAALGPLHGVPVTIKESIDLAGSPTTHGVVAYKDCMPERDAPVVAHLKRAGAIPIARTNLPDFGARWHTANDLRGATLNPWDPLRTPGGSSGGEAVAIATGMSPLGLGNDQGGSLRYPAQCCGITAIRPSLGRVSRISTAVFADPPSFYEQVASVNGPMARRVADLRLALEVLSRPDPQDPWWSPAPPRGPTPAGPVPVAVTTDPTGCGISPRVAAGIGKAGRILAEAGYAVDAVDPPSLAEAGEVIQQIWDMEIQGYLPKMLPMMSAEGRSVLEALLGETPTEPSVYMAAIGRRYRIAQDWNRFLERYPLVLGPVSTLEPFEVGTDVAGRAQLRRFVRSIGLTELCNLLGLPGLAVPVQGTGGLPQGVQLIAARFREDLCLDAAEVIEDRQGIFTPLDPRETAVTEGAKKH